MPEDNTSIERKIIIPWFERFETVNKGLLRVLTIILIVHGVFWLIFIFNIERAVAVFPMIIVAALAHSAIITTFRILIWLYDGFVNQ